jgi:hypothetical protein
MTPPWMWQATAPPRAARRTHASESPTSGQVWASQRSAPPSSRYSRSVRITWKSVRATRPVIPSRSASTRVSLIRATVW